jgi:hypothetical protein
MLLRTVLSACLAIFWAAGSRAQDYVPGHYESDGTYVAPSWNSGIGGDASASGAPSYGARPQPRAKAAAAKAKQGRAALEHPWSKPPEVGLTTKMPKTAPAVIKPADPYAYRPPSYPDFSADGTSTYTYTPPTYPTYTPK